MLRRVGLPSRMTLAIVCCFGLTFRQIFNPPPAHNYNEAILNAPTFATDTSSDIDTGGTNTNKATRAIQASCPMNNNDTYFLPEEPDGSLVETLRQNLTQESFHELFRNCSVTSQVQIIPGCSRSDSFWELQTLDAQGQAKTVGGDEFYIIYTDDADAIVDHDATAQTHPTAVAEVVDLQTGRYRLEFQTSPLNHHPRHHHHHPRLQGSGTVTVHFQYTCGIGRMAPPTKEAWQTGGNTVARYTTHVHAMPPIAPFAPPPRIPPITVDLSFPFHHIVPFGDSILQQFMEPLNIRMPNIGRPLNTSTVVEWTTRLDTKFGLDLQQPHTVLVASSHAWDLLDSENLGGFGDHRQALQHFVTHVRTKYPNVTLVWKSPTALHVHVPMLQIQQGDDQRLRRQFGKKKLFDRLRYMSASRSYELYLFQKNLCSEWKIPFLDVYQASYLSADHTKIGDGRHFTKNWNAMTVNWFVSDSHVEQLWKHYRNRQASQQRRRRARILVVRHCNSWIDIVNAVLVAMVTNRGVKWELQRNCPLPLRMSSNDSLHHNPSQENALEFQGVDEPLTLEALEKLGYLTTDPSQRMIKELFSEGAAFLYGMILHDLLEWPAPSLLPSRLDSSKSIVFAAYEAEGKDVNTCMTQLFMNATKPAVPLNHLPCHVLVASQEIANSLNSMLRIQHNCRAIAATTTDEGLLAFVQLTADMAYDGYMLPCASSSSSKLFSSMVHYLRAKKARRAGSLPLEELPTCCFE